MHHLNAFFKCIFDFTGGIQKQLVCISFFHAIEKKMHPPQATMPNAVVYFCIDLALFRDRAIGSYFRAEKGHCRKIFLII